MRPVHHEEQVLATISDGSFYITNKMIVFEGNKKSTTIKLGSLFDLDLYSDAIEVKKSRGQHDIFIPDPSDVEYGSLIITHFLSSH